MQGREEDLYTHCKSLSEDLTQAEARAEELAQQLAAEQETVRVKIMY